MKHITEVLEEMGFSKDSSPSTQAAFVKYLIKKGFGVDVEIPQKFLDIAHQNENSESAKETQLSFSGLDRKQEKEAS